jgi:hypothetical protein
LGDSELRDTLVSDPVNAVSTQQDEGALAVRAVANDGSLFQFRTENLSPAERLPTWHDIFGRSVSRRVLSPLSDDLFHVNMTVHHLVSGGGESNQRVCVQHMTLTTGFSAQRTAELLADGNDDIVLHIHETGRRAVSQLGRQASAEPFNALLTSNADQSTIILPEPARFFSIGLPRKTMSALVPGIEDALMHPLSGDVSVVRLLVGYLKVLEQEQALGTPDLKRAVIAHIHDLAAVIVGAPRHTVEIAHRRGYEPLAYERSRPISPKNSQAAMSGLLLWRFANALVPVIFTSCSKARALLFPIMCLGNGWPACIAYCPIQAMQNTPSEDWLSKSDLAIYRLSTAPFVGTTE